MSESGADRPPPLSSARATQTRDGPRGGNCARRAAGRLLVPCDTPGLAGLSGKAAASRGLGQLGALCACGGGWGLHATYGEAVG